MTHEERALIQDLEKCDFGEIHAMHKAKVEARKNMTKEEKLVWFGLLFFKKNLYNYQYGTSHSSSVQRLKKVSVDNKGLINWFVGFERGKSEDSG